MAPIPVAPQADGSSKRAVRRCRRAGSPSCPSSLPTAGAPRPRKPRPTLTFVAFLVFALHPPDHHVDTVSQTTPRNNTPPRSSSTEAATALSRNRGTAATPLRPLPPTRPRARPSSPPPASPRSRPGGSRSGTSSTSTGSTPSRPPAAPNGRLPDLMPAVAAATPAATGPADSPRAGTAAMVGVMAPADTEAVLTAVDMGPASTAASTRRARRRRSHPGMAAWPWLPAPVWSVAPCSQVLCVCCSLIIIPHGSKTDTTAQTTRTRTTAIAATRNPLPRTTTRRPLLRRSTPMTQTTRRSTRLARG